MSKLINIFVLAYWLAGCAIFPAHPIVTGKAIFESKNDLDAVLSELEEMHLSNGLVRAPFETHTWHLLEGDKLAFLLGYKINDNILHVRLVSHNLNALQTKEIASRIEMHLGKHLSKDSFDLKYVEQSSPFT